MHLVMFTGGNCISYESGTVQRTAPSTQHRGSVSVYIGATPLFSESLARTLDLQKDSLPILDLRLDPGFLRT